MPNPPALTPGWFLEEVTRLAGAGFAPAQPIALAVSGGADSLALLYLGAAAFGDRAHVLTVDHGLRPEAAAECAMVVQLATSLGLPASVVRLSLDAGGNLQARARTARYQQLGVYCRALGLGWLLTAHHQDDQAETLLLRLVRGSGLSGLAGIGADTELAGTRVLRPLLGRKRAELAAIVTAAGWTAAQDPSNADPRFDRTKARSLLAKTPWLAAERLAATATHLQQAEAALSWAADRAWDSRVEHGQDGRLTLKPEALPDELRRRLLARGLTTLGGNPDGPSLARLLARLDAGKSGTLGPAIVRPKDGCWIIAQAPARRQPAV